MRNSTQFFVLIFSFLFIAASLQAQENQYESKNRRWNINIAGGMGSFRGDVPGKNTVQSLKASIGYGFSGDIFLAGFYRIGRLNGEGIIDEIPLHFENEYTMMGLEAQINIFDFIQLSRQALLHPYIKFGIANFKSSISSATPSPSELIGIKNYNGHDISLIPGLGFKLHIGSYFALSFNWDYLLTTTDMIDGFRWQSDANRINDHFSLYELGATFQFGKKFKSKEKNIQPEENTKDNELIKEKEVNKDLEKAPKDKAERKKKTEKKVDRKKEAEKQKDEKSRSYEKLVAENEKLMEKYRDSNTKKEDPDNNRKKEKEIPSTGPIPVTPMFFPDGNPCLANFYLVGASFTKLEHAQNELINLLVLGYNPLIICTKEKTVYRVCLGVYDLYEEVLKASAAAKANYNPDVWIIRNK